MKTFVIPQRELPAAYEADVVVCGGGTAGVFAAISAAESGKRVLIVEQFGSLGGSATNGLVTPLMHSHIAGDPACSYISLRLREKLKLYGGVDGSGRAFDSTVLKLALEELCAEAGVQLLYHTFISDVLVENGVVKAVVAGNKSGTVVIAGDMFIDCTGDGDVSVLAGAQYAKGNPETGKNQPISLRYVVGGVDIPVAGWGIDFLVSSANKCIHGVPGFSFILANREKLEASDGQARSLALDLYDQWKTMNEDGKWRFTSPTHVVLAFAQALEELKAEGGVPARHARYDQNQRLLAENFRALGFVPYLDPAVQGPIITTFRYPAGARFTFQQMYEYIKARGYVLYPGKVMEAETFRVGNIGEIYPEDIAKLSAILADFLKEVAA